jgi:hypothetical protein
MRCKRFPIRTAVAAAVAGAALAVAATATAAGIYTDPSGDSNGAADIQNVMVSSDPSGQILIAVNVDNVGTSGFMFVAIDSDMNTATGSPDAGGADYAFMLDTAASTYYFYRWNGSDWDDSVPPSTATVRRTSTTVLFSINRSELGNTNEFNFWVRTATADTSAQLFDTAPDALVWNFSLAAQGPELDGVLYQPIPFVPKHAQQFQVKPMGVKLPPSVMGAIVPQPDSYSCRATLAGKSLTGTGVGGCTWRLPKKSKGKSFVVSLTVTYEGATTTIRQAYTVA